MKAIFVVCLLFVAANAQDLPPFLQGASQDQIDQFKQILAEAPSKTDAQMEEIIQNWADSQGGEIASAFQQFKQNMIEREQQAQARHEAAIANLSPAAKDADAKLTAIGQNPDLTGAEKQQQIQEVLASLSPEVKQELQQAAQQS